MTALVPTPLEHRPRPARAQVKGSSLLWLFRTTDHAARPDRHPDQDRDRGAVLHRQHLRRRRAACAHDKIAPLARYAPEPTEFARVRLIPDGPRTIAVHATLDVDGTQVFAKAEEAVDRVHDELQTLLLHQ